MGVPRNMSRYECFYMAKLAQPTATKIPSTSWKSSSSVLPPPPPAANSQSRSVISSPPPPRK
ncbi:hypothetical protein HYC85_001628 [Camellia sinensis]|uniref:Uncharacterized protein n=1 Tax=Camellia sinensis TaxID=4442 RepID=A0A7J7I663_CAMSI|nr:hypothetical protein HYC85_001628 [Camellia sinensis]